MLVKTSSISELFTLIEQDINTNIPNARRYPVRIIFVHQKDSFKTVVKYLSNISNIIEINTILDNEDKWLTPDSIHQILSEVQTTTTFLPFGEFLRFCDDITFNSLLNSIFEIENNRNNKRIYLPILGIRDDFMKLFFKRFHRREALIPIWEIDEPNEKKTTIYQLKSELKTKLQILSTSSEWMNVWKKESNFQIISNSLVLSYLYEKYLPDPIFQMVPILNYKELLSEIHHFYVPFDYIERENELWELLNKKIEHLDVKRNQNFDDFISLHFNIRDMDFRSNEFLKLWFESDAIFSKWLLKKTFLLRNNPEESYLAFVFEKLSDLSEKTFLHSLWITPYLLTINNDMLNQRKKILSFIHKDLKISYQFTENEISFFLKNSKNSIENLSELITDITFSERLFILRNFNNNSQNDFNISFLEKNYSDIFYYMNWDNVEVDSSNKWIKDYFQEYCLSKVINSKTERLNAILVEKNKNSSSFYDWYYNLKLTKISKDCKCLWIDGLGAEWLPYIIHILNIFCKKSNYAISYSNFSRVNIPSTTDNNRFDNAEHILDFDRFNHSEHPFKHPNSLIKQLDCIKEIIEVNINNTSADKIQIVSDHGFTFLAQKKYGNFKTLDFENDSHEGRCMFTEDNIRSDNDFLVHKIDEGKLKGKQAMIALRHKSLNKIPYREVHGGATPEEVIVPFIELVKIDNNIEYSYRLENENISIKKPELNVSIIPKPFTIPKLYIDGKILNFKESKNGMWSIKLSGFGLDNYNCNLIIDNKNYDLKVRIIGGLIENELF
ncbi:MAG: BREX-4 system phosphatase PglZ [Candidatus Cloacimonetes bacterium]|nr:BREX-4 system phosphatase PglZ [Candidatus Cloacimonadota bacterium]